MDTPTVFQALAPLRRRVRHILEVETDHPSWHLVLRHVPLPPDAERVGFRWSVNRRWTVLHFFCRRKIHASP